MKYSLVIVLLVVLAVPGRAQEAAADPEPFDLGVIPSGVVAGLAIRDLSDLKRKVAGLAKQTEGQFSSMLTLGASFAPTIFRDYLGLSDSLDESGSAAVVSFAAEDSFALILPITNLSDAARAFEVSRDALEAGKLVKSDKHAKLGSEIWMTAKGSHIVMGTQAAVAQTLKTGRLSDVLEPDTQSVFAEDDLFLTFDFAKMRELIEERQINPGRGITALVPNALVGFVNEGELDRVSMGFKIQDGLDGTFLFDFDGPESKNMLTKLQNQTRKSTLTGLPVGTVVFATSRSTGPESGDVIGDLADYFTPVMGQFLGLKSMVAPQHVAGLMSVFKEGAYRVPGARAAIYQNDPADRRGAFCMISILDTDDGDAFVDEIAELIPIVNLSLSPHEDPKDRIDEAAIAKMVSFLSHESTRAREFMSAKLRLLGPRALASLRQAAQSDDATTRGRAEKLVQQIESDLAEQRAAFLAGRVADQLQPRFGYLPDFETVSDQSVDAIQVDLNETEPKVSEQLRYLLGPNWNRIRLCRIENQVVIMLGSHETLFGEAITNVVDGAAGMESLDHYSSFREQMPGELMGELHISMAAAAAGSFAVSTKPTNAVDAQWFGEKRTSMGLSISPQQIRFDFRLPVEELHVLTKTW